QVAVLRRGRDGEHRRVGLDAGLVPGDRSARSLHRLRIVPGEVRADPRPALALVGGFPYVLRADVENARIDRRENDRERPLEPFRDPLRRIAHRVGGVWVDWARLTGLPIEAGNQVAVASGEE